MIGLALAVSTAVSGIVAAFSHHPVVAIAEAHMLREAGDFYIALVRDTAFQRIAPAIVIEFASRQSQPLLDAYILQGDSIPLDSLRSIWRNSTKVAGWESPVYARWLAAIRDVNRHLPAGRRLRVFAGDTRIDWPAMHAPSDWAALGPNNVSFSHVIADDILAKGHRAFVVLGSNHLMRTGARDGSANTTTMVEERYHGAMFVAWLYNGRPGGNDVDARIASEHRSAPSLVPMRESWIGSIPVGTLHFADLADALLYLGPPASLTVEQAPASDFDATYRRELDRRSWIEWGDSARARTFLKLPPLPPAGRVSEVDIESRILHRARHLWVYTPPDYDRACATADGCALVVAFDGGVYTGAIPFPEILDSLIAAHAIAPTVAVMIDNANGAERVADLGNRAAFASFLADELVPWTRAHYRVTHAARRTIVTGSSAGGLAAAYVAFKRPDLFGNVLSQSGAFWRGNEGTNAAPFEWLTEQYASAPAKPIRFFVDVGSTESIGAMNGTAPSILQANRHLHDALTARGYSVEYFEIPGGVHAPSTWQKRLPMGLVALDAQP